MAIDNTLEQIGKMSSKVLFRFDLSAKRFDLLSDAVRSIWDRDAPKLRQDPALLLQTVAEADRAAVLRCWQKLMEGEHVDKTVRIEQGKNTRHVRYDVYPIKDEQGRVVALAGMAEDVSRQTEFLNYLAEFAQRKDSMLEMVSHDLRGPLAVVKNMATLVREEVQESKQGEVEKYTHIIESACNTCTNLINDLLSEEHLRSPEVSVNKTRVDLNEQILNVLESYRRSRVVSQQFELNLPDEPLMLELDQIKFSQILNNLISNSLKFTPPSGQITISARREGEEVVLEHHDNGIGIPERLKPALFDKYTRSGRVGLNGEESRGLGLAIVRALVELQGGRIWVESQEHKGTSFFIHLPLHDS